MPITTGQLFRCLLPPPLLLPVLAGPRQVPSVAPQELPACPCACRLAQGPPRASLQWQGIASLSSLCSSPLMCKSSGRVGKSSERLSKEPPHVQQLRCVCACACPAFGMLPPIRQLARAAPSLVPLLALLLPGLHRAEPIQQWEQSYEPGKDDVECLIERLKAGGSSDALGLPCCTHDVRL